MNIENLKTGLFGFKKTSVFQYISEIEERFSEKLAEKDEFARTNEAQYRARVAQLEADLLDARQQLDAQRNDQWMISATLLDAHRYADTLKKETEKTESAACRQLNDILRQKQLEIEHYAVQISELQAMFRELLRKMDHEAQLLCEHTQEVAAACPECNMSLFARSPQAEEQALPLPEEPIAQTADKAGSFFQSYVEDEGNAQLTDKKEPFVQSLEQAERITEPVAQVEPDVESLLPEEAEVESPLAGRGGEQSDSQTAGICPSAAQDEKNLQSGIEE